MMNDDDDQRCVPRRRPVWESLIISIGVFIGMSWAVQGAARQHSGSLSSAPRLTHAGQIHNFSPDQPPGEPVRVEPLTTIEQVRELTRQQAALKPELCLRAVVTFYDPANVQLFIQDDTAGIWVDTQIGPKPDLKVGDLVEVRGVAVWTDFAPDVGSPRFQVLGRAPLPSALRASFSRLTSTHLNSRRVEVEGVVLDAAKQGDQPRLTVEVDGGTVNVWIPRVPGPIPANLVDAKVRVQGVIGATFNKKNQLISVRLNVPSLADVHVIEVGPRDPFAGPVRSISSLLRFVPKNEPGRVRVRGVVTLQQVGRGLFIQDGNDGLYVESNQRTRLEVGDNVEVAGFPSVSQGLSPILKHAIFRSLGTRAQVSPHPVVALQVLQGEHDSELVRITGHLLHDEELHGERVLTMEADSATFDVDLRPHGRSQGLPPLEIGSLLELTGVCSVQANDEGVPTDFWIILRSGQDIAVLRTPSWWTATHALSVLGLAILAGVFSLFWIHALRRRVRRQTEIIRLQMESEAALQRHYRDLFENAADVIYTLDLKGNFTSLNKAGERLLGLTRHQIQGKNLSEVAAPENHDLARRSAPAEPRGRGGDGVRNGGHDRRRQAAFVGSKFPADPCGW